MAADRKARTDQLARLGYPPVEVAAPDGQLGGHERFGAAHAGGEQRQRLRHLAAADEGAAVARHDPSFAQPVQPQVLDSQRLLSPETTAELLGLAGRIGVPVATLLRGAWALLQAYTTYLIQLPEYQLT